MIVDYLLDKTNLIHIFVLIDSRLKPQAIDLDFVNWMCREHKSFSLVFTKSDKATQKEVATNVKAFFNELSAMTRDKPKHYITTCMKQHTVQPLLDDIHEMSKNFVPDLEEHADDQTRTDQE